MSYIESGLIIIQYALIIGYEMFEYIYKNYEYYKNNIKNKNNLIR
jgi:hypothetical protein